MKEEEDNSNYRIIEEPLFDQRLLADVRKRLLSICSR